MKVEVSFVTLSRWSRSPESAKGKGLAIESVQRFFASLRMTPLGKEGQT
jgi:hypothetical protein